MDPKEQLNRSQKLAEALAKVVAEHTNELTDEKERQAVAIGGCARLMAMASILLCRQLNKPGVPVTVPQVVMCIANGPWQKTVTEIMKRYPEPL